MVPDKEPPILFRHFGLKIKYNEQTPSYFNQNMQIVHVNPASKRGLAKKRLGPSPGRSQFRTKLRSRVARIKDLALSYMHTSDMLLSLLSL